eukprot:947996_1
MYTTLPRSNNQTDETFNKSQQMKHVVIVQWMKHRMNGTSIMPDTSLINIQYVVFPDKQYVLLLDVLLNQNGTFSLLEAILLYLQESRHTNRIESIVALRAFQD